MDGLKQWLISLVFSAAAGTLITVISPKGSNDKTIKTVVGIFIISAVFVPLSEMKASDFSLPVFAQEDISDNNYMNDFMIEMLENELFAKASEIAEEFGCELEDVELDAEYGEDKCIIIHKMNVYFKNYNDENACRAATEIENKLGVPVWVDNGI